jgi:hypothetical protein
MDGVTGTWSLWTVLRPHNTTTEHAASPLAVEDFINNFRKPLMQPILLSPPHKAGSKE